MGDTVRRKLIAKGAMATTGLSLIPSISFADISKTNQEYIAEVNVVGMRDTIIRAEWAI